MWAEVGQGSRQQGTLRTKKDRFPDLWRKWAFLAILDQILVSDTGKNGVRIIFGSRRMADSGAHEAAGQLSGEGGREGSVEDTRRVSRRIEGVRESVLHHQHHRLDGQDLPDESLVGDRRQAGSDAKHEPGNEEVSDADELLRADGGAGWTGEAIASDRAARSGGDQRRRRRPREPGLPGSHEPYESFG